MNKKSIVLYKNSVAVVNEIEADKYIIKYCSQPASPTGKKAVYIEQKVREKDLVVLHEGPVSSLENLLSFSDEKMSSQIEEVYELLQSDSTTENQPLSLQELSEYARNSFIADESWAFYTSLVNDVHFSLSTEDLKNGKIVFIPRTSKEIEQINQKKYEKEHESEIKAAFFERLKNRKLDLPSDAKYMGEVEAFALCKTDKSKVLAEAKIPQTVEKAHQLLIETGIWDITKNPYPTRYGFSFDSAREQLGKMPKEERLVLNDIAYAIDGENSTDPDDAISFDGECLWVHVADPASSVQPDSSIDIAARDRGTTLYIPEGASRMLCESCLEDYALGLKNPSNALSFKIYLDEESQIVDCHVYKTTIQVKRLTYAQVELLKDSSEMKVFFEIARKNKARREKNGAVTIQMPEVSISVDKNTKKVTVEPEVKYESNEMVAECMILAGEGAAKFAFKNQIPFPFVSQDPPDFPPEIPSGWAGSFAKIKCMRKRSVGIIPGRHSGLGVSFYSQVTSPLRRYGDLIAHQQLRAFIDKRHLLGKDEMLERVAAGDAASIAAKKASRFSDTHWKLVYLLQNPDNEYEGFCIDKRGNDALFLIPKLDMQTTMKNCIQIELNESRMLKMKKVDIPTQIADFTFIS